MNNFFRGGKKFFYLLEIDRRLQREEDGEPREHAGRVS